MINKEDIKKKYSDSIHLFEQTKEEILFILNYELEKAKIKTHNIQYRIKNLSSLINKAESHGIENMEDVFVKITDIVGLRVICLFVSDIEEISKVITQVFDVLTQDNKIDNSESSNFGYFSVHFICKLKQEYRGPRYDSIKDILFEIQVRTISMDAWANISHYLDYKSEVEIPKELKRDFFALSGLFYVADTHFEMFFKNKKARAKIAQENVASSLDEEINYETLEAYINSKFAKRPIASSDDISSLTQELIAYGYKTIGELDATLTKYFKIKPENNLPAKFNRVGAVRMTLRGNDPEYEKMVMKKLFSKK